MDLNNTTPRPLISVITVTFNAAEFLDGCLESITTQINADFELIIIDGGSSDSTVDIIKKYNDSIAYWHTKGDRGLTHAFNLGIEKSRGHWLAFINADDFLANSDTLFKVSNELKSNGSVDVVYGQVLVVNRSDPKLIVGGPYGKNFSWVGHLFSNKIPHQGAFINRLFFSKYGLYDESYKIGSDYELFLRKKSQIIAIYIPILISKMRDGGVSRLNQFLCNKEWHLGRVKNKLLPYPILFLIYSLIYIKMKIGVKFRYLIKYNDN